MHANTRLNANIRYTPKHVSFKAKLRKSKRIQNWSYNGKVQLANRSSVPLQSSASLQV